MSEFEERALLIGSILDKIMPIPESAPESIKDSIDTDRQMLVMRAGWDSMSITELRQVASK